MIYDLLSKEEQEIYGGEYPATSGDHHQDLYDFNFKHEGAEYYQQELLLQEQDDDRY
jgi:hypothetical protein